MQKTLEKFVEFIKENKSSLGETLETKSPKWIYEEKSVRISFVETNENAPKIDRYTGKTVPKLIIQFEWLGSFGYRMSHFELDTLDNPNDIQDIREEFNKPYTKEFSTLFEIILKRAEANSLKNELQNDLSQDKQSMPKKVKV